MSRLKQNFSTSDLSFSQVTEVEKRKLRKRFFEAYAVGRGREMFPRFEFFPSYRSRKKGIEAKFFEAEAVGRGREMFPRFPFFY